MPEKTTTAQIVQPTTQTPYPVSSGEATVLGSFVAFAVGFVIYLRRKVPRDSLGIALDRAEGQMLQQARADRDKAVADAREAWTLYNADQRLMGELKAENSYLQRELLEARTQLAEIRRGVMAVGRTVDATKSSLDQAQRRIGNSGVTPLGKE